MREPTVELYSNSQVCYAEKKIELMRKRASTTAHQAYFPRNLMLHKMYFTTYYPTGILDVNINDMIDINEMGLYLETTNRKLGKTIRGMRADNEGNYNRDEKSNILAAMAADGNDAMRWMETWTGEGTTIIRFLHFICQICDTLEEQHPQRSFCFTIDNLNVHKNAMVIHEILS